MKKTIILFLTIFLLSCEKNILENKVEKINSKTGVLENSKKEQENFIAFNYSSYENEDRTFSKYYSFKSKKEFYDFLKNYSEKITIIHFTKEKYKNQEVLEILEKIKGYEDENFSANFQNNLQNIDEKIFEKLSEFNSKIIEILFLEDLDISEKIEIPPKIWKKFLENKNINTVFIRGENFVLINENGKETNIIYDGKNKKIEKIKGILENSKKEKQEKEILSFTYSSYKNKDKTFYYENKFRSKKEFYDFFKKYSKKITDIYFYEKLTNQEVLEILEKIKGYEDEIFSANFQNIDEKIFEKLSEFNSKFIKIELLDVSEVSEKIEISPKIWKKFLENNNIDLVLINTTNGKSFVLIDENGKETNIIYDGKTPKIFSDVYNFSSSFSGDMQNEAIKIFEERSKKYYGEKKLLWVE